MPARHVPGACRVAKLVRVSTTHLEQADSPQHQQAFIEAELRREGYVDTGRLYRAELTGAVILDRPDIQRLLADARQGLFDAVALKSISRLGRDTLGLLMVKRVLDDLEIELLAFADGYRSFRDPELIFLVHAERAQAGRQEIARSVRVGVVEAARRGIWPGGRLPFGYRREGRLAIVPDPQTAAVVRAIFQRRGQGWGLVRICQYLNQEMAVPSPEWWHLRERLARLSREEADDRTAARMERLRRRLAVGRFRWHPRTVRMLLQNTAYRGELRYNRTENRRRLHGRLTRVPRDPAQWVTIACPPLVTPEEWEAAQRMGRSQDRLPRRSRTSRWLLSGLAVCGCCGSPLRAQAARGNTGRRGGDPRGYYVCRGSVEAGLHPAAYIRATALEEAVLAALRQVLGSLPPPDPLPAPRPRATGAEASLEQQLRELAEARYFRREELRRGQMSRAEFAAEVQIIQEREAALHERLQALRERAAAARGAAEAREEEAVAPPAPVQPGDLFRLQGPVALLKPLVAALVERVVVHPPDAVEVQTTFSREEVESGSHCQVPNAPADGSA